MRGRPAENLIPAWWDIVLERIQNGEPIEPLPLLSSYSLADLIIAAEESQGGNRGRKR